MIRRRVPLVQAGDSSHVEVQQKSRNDKKGMRIASNLQGPLHGDAENDITTGQGRMGVLQRNRFKVVHNACYSSDSQRESSVGFKSYAVQCI